MNRICLFLGALLFRIVAVSTNFTLEANVPRIINLKTAEGTMTLTLKSIPQNTAYIICQAHTQVQQLSLSTTTGFSISSTARGGDVGVVSLVNATSSVVWYLRLSSGSEARVMVHATLLTANDPLPGGCNEEFNMENDPNIHLTQATTTATVKFQWSNLGYQPSIGTSANCEKNGNLLKYQSYVRFIQSAEYDEDTYFDTLKETLLAKDVVKHGTWLEDLQSQRDRKSMFTISSYSGQGVIYTVVVQETNLTTGKITQAAYIPVVAYDCTIKKDCGNKEIAAMIFSTVGLFVGLLLCFFGHRFFKTENFVFGFLIFSLVLYQVLALKTNISLVGILVLSGVFGCLGGILLLGLWWRVGLPVLNVLFIGLVFGYLFSSVLFYTPFANMNYWDAPFNYGITFTCGILILPVFMLFFTRMLNIVSCAVVGAYGLILAIDVYVGSGMKYIVVNSLRHGTDVDYVKVIITGPFTTKEIILTILWILMAILGTTFQYIRERKRAPFPPCPRRSGDGYDHLRHLLHQNAQQAATGREPVIRGGNVPPARGHNSRQIRNDNMRQPLLQESRRNMYGSMHKTESTDEDSEEDSRPGLV